MAELSCMIFSFFYYYHRKHASTGIGIPVPGIGVYGTGIGIPVPGIGVYRTSYTRYRSVCHSYTFHGCRLRLAYVVTDGGTQNPSITTTRLTRQVEPGTFETYKLVKTSRWTLCFGELVCKLNRTPYVGAALDMLSPCTIWL